MLSTPWLAAYELSTECCTSDDGGRNQLQLLDKQSHHPAIIVNDMGELMAFKMSKATTDDRVVLPKMAENLTGKIIGDKGYISQKLFDQLYEKGLQLITKIRKNMKNKLVLMIDKILLRKRGIIESVFDQLKNISQIEHSRHRSADNFMVNIVAGLAAYCLQEKKPSLGIKYNLLNG